MKTTSKNGILCLSGNGQWVKCIKRKVRTFGAQSADATGIKAEAKYFAEKDAWERGENPRVLPVAAGAIFRCVRELADTWLEYRRGLLTTDDPEKRISGISYGGSRVAMAHLCAFKGDGADPTKWTPDTWQKCRAYLAKGVSPNTLTNRIIHIRAMFKWAVSNGKIAALPKWEDNFKTVSTDTVEEYRYDFQKKNGDRRFEIEDARIILKASEDAVASVGRRISEMSIGGGAKVERAMLISAYLMRAAHWIAANTGAYSKDIASLEFADLDLDNAYLERKRAKTARLWQATLWPETVQYIREYLEVRPEPARPEWRNLVFLTSDGFPGNHGKDKLNEKGEYIGNNRTDAIGQAAADLLIELGLKAPGLAFGAWRHTVCSIASALPGYSERIVNRIMAHKINGAANSYVKFRPDQLRPITDGIRGVLFPTTQGQGNLRLVG